MIKCIWCGNQRKQFEWIFIFKMFMIDKVKLRFEIVLNADCCCCCCCVWVGQQPLELREDVNILAQKRTHITNYGGQLTIYEESKVRIQCKTSAIFYETHWFPYHSHLIHMIEVAEERILYGSIRAFRLNLHCQSQSKMQKKKKKTATHMKCSFLVFRFACILCHKCVCCCHYYS